MSLDTFSLNVRRFIELFDLQDAGNYYWLFNTALNMPYHNATHIDFMLQDLISLVNFNAINQSSLDPNFLSVVSGKKDIALLGEAIIFHDFNHSGGMLADSDNIAIAISAYRNYFYMFSDNGNSTILIEGTEYPYKELSSTPDQYLRQQVLRDLDLMTIFHIIDDPEKTCAQFRGLYTEILVSKPDLTWDQFKIGNTKFLQDSVFYTDFGKKQASECLEKCLVLFNKIEL